MRIKFPWPHKDLSPNGRKHRMEVARLKKRAKSDAFFEASAHEDCRAFRGASGVHVDLVFLPPDRRKRDLDNMLGSCKAMLDGLSEAIGVDDSTWSLSLCRGDAVSGGAVVVTVSAGHRPNAYTDIHKRIIGGRDE